MAKLRRQIKLLQGLRKRKSGKMLHVLCAWNIHTMLFFFFVLLMTRVAVPICVELAFVIPTVLISTRKLIPRQFHLIGNLCKALQVCSTAFAYYAQATAAQEIFGHTLESLRGIKYLYKWVSLDSSASPALPSGGAKMVPSFHYVVNLEHTMGLPSYCSNLNSNKSHIFCWSSIRNCASHTKKWRTKVFK